MTEEQIHQIFEDILCPEPRKPEPAPVVRVATRADELPLLELLRCMHSEPNGSGHRDWNGDPYPLDEDLLREAIYAVTAPDGRGCCGVIEGPRGLEASMALIVTSPYYSRRQYLGDPWTYVMPEYRGGAHYSMLVAFAKSVAARMHMDLHLGNFSEGRAAAKDRLLERTLDGKKFGSTYVFQYNPTGIGG